MNRRLYIDYHRLGATSYREKMKFFESNQKYIDHLHFDEVIDLKIDYLMCLFEVGRYERYLQFVDEMLEIVITENIFTFKGENIFVELLFKKAACLYHTKAYRASMNILKQLRTMEPKHADVSQLYALCKRQLPYDLITSIRAIGMAALLVVAGIALSRILVVSAFFEDALEYFSNMQWFLVGLSVLAFVVAEFIFQYKTYKELGVFPSWVLNRIVDLYRNIIRKNAK